LFDFHFEYRYNSLVKPEIARQLLDLNYLFYQTFADQFSATRQKIQPGVDRLMAEISASRSILDFGCGNANVWVELARRGFLGTYLGLDFSSHLLDQAARQVCADHQLSTDHPLPHFALVDLIDPDWGAQMPAASFDAVLSFAVIHHLPGQELRLQFLQQIHRILETDGSFYFSVWQFLNSDRLRQRVRSWTQVGLSENQVDPGDYLLDWRSGGLGYRYVHHFSPTELHEMAELSGFRVVKSFYSDGKGDQLGYYQVWQLEK